jgi:hypothetical protein
MPLYQIIFNFDRTYSSNLNFVIINVQGVITQIVSWENPNISINSVTQLGVRTNVTLVITPLILVTYDSTTMEASWVTLGEWRE